MRCCVAGPVTRGGISAGFARSWSGRAVSEAGGRDRLTHVDRVEELRQVSDVQAVEQDVPDARFQVNVDVRA